MTVQKVLPFGEDLGGVAFIEVFTTRPDTIFGVSFVTLAPEHELVEKIDENYKHVVKTCYKWRTACGSPGDGSSGYIHRIGDKE